MKCHYSNNKLIETPCKPPYYEVKGYFVDGSSYYACEEHRKINPFLGWKKIKKQLKKKED